jgi:hypothetical protein
MIIGVLSLVVFYVWEAKVAKFPFMAHELFIGQGRKFVLFLVVDFVAGMGLYAAAVFWAQLVRGVWEGNPIDVGILSLPGGLGGAGESCITIQSTVILMISSWWFWSRYSHRQEQVLCHQPLSRLRLRPQDCCRCIFRNDLALWPSLQVLWHGHGFHFHVWYRVDISLLDCLRPARMCR